MKSTGFLFDGDGQPKPTGWVSDACRLHWDGEQKLAAEQGQGVLDMEIQAAQEAAEQADAPPAGGEAAPPAEAPPMAKTCTPCRSTGIWGSTPGTVFRLIHPRRKVAGLRRPSPPTIPCTLNIPC
jgi:hypothetical protein